MKLWQATQKLGTYPSRKAAAELQGLAALGEAALLKNGVR